MMHVGTKRSGTYTSRWTVIIKKTALTQVEPAVTWFVFIFLCIKII